MKAPFEVMIVDARQLVPHQWAMVEIGARYVLLIASGAVCHGVLAEAWAAFVKLHRSRGVEYLYEPGAPFAHLVPFPSAEVGGIAVCGCEPWLGLGDRSEWEHAHELPLCRACAKWRTAGTSFEVPAVVENAALLLSS